MIEVGSYIFSAALLCMTLFFAFISAALFKEVSYVSGGVAFFIFFITFSLILISYLN